MYGSVVLNFSMKALREDVMTDDKNDADKRAESGPKASYGYGGKFGVQKDRMDKVYYKIYI